MSTLDPADQTVAVLGLGKIGLPLAAQFASKGCDVIGCDVDAEVVAAVNGGRSHIANEAGLAEAVAAAVAGGRLRATTDTPSAIRAARTVIVIVPLTLTPAGDLDYANLDDATRVVARSLQPGTLVIYETTLPVGTTRVRLAPMLMAGSNLALGTELFVAFSPERVYSGRIFQDLRRYPKVVGGTDSVSSARAAAFYREVLDAEVIELTNADTAEFMKLAETTYRDVNIALANQLALFARRRGIDGNEAFEAANTQPFSHLHRPGIGVGGHCIPVYPRFLLAGSHEELELVRAARRINDGMAGVAVAELTKILGSLKGRRVLLLGLAYRENVKELANSVALRLIPLLKEAGADVAANDPLFSQREVAHLGVPIVATDRPVAVDAIVIQAFHRQYAAIDWDGFPGLGVVFDGRSALDPRRLPPGVIYVAVGNADHRPAS